MKKGLHLVEERKQRTVTLSIASLQCPGILYTYKHYSPRLTQFWILAIFDRNWRQYEQIKSIEMAGRRVCIYIVIGNYHSIISLCVYQTQSLFLSVFALDFLSGSMGLTYKLSFVYNSYLQYSKMRFLIASLTPIRVVTCLFQRLISKLPC